MSDTEKPPEAPATSEAPPAEEVKADAPPAEEAKAEEPKAEWKFKRNLGINEEMKKVIHLTIDAANAEIAVLRRKLERLTYGS